MENNEKKEYSVEEVAQLLKVHQNTVRGFAAHGILPGTMKSEPAQDDPLGWHAEWSFTQEDLDVLSKNLERHAREKILCETGRYHEVVEERNARWENSPYQDLVEQQTARWKARHSQEGEAK